MSEPHISICRFCHAFCGIKVEVEAGRVVKIIGDTDDPSTYGYTCQKGRSLPEQHYHPERLLQPLKRMPDGSQRAIASGKALDEIAEKLRRIVDQCGPRSVAVYAGTYQMGLPAAVAMAQAWMRALGSPMYFHSGSIDQPGKGIAAALHGMWDAGTYPFEEADTWMLVGSNPLVSMWGGLGGFNPARQLHEARKRGLKLIVIDPRISESAQHANIHLQIRPGEDPTLLAGLIRVIIEESLYDADFVAEDTQGLETLRETVEPFIPAYVEQRAGVPAGKLIAAARMFASGKRGCVTAGSGPNMSPRGNLSEYLALAINSLCGRWVRPGEPVYQPFALLPKRSPRAQSQPQFPGWGYGEKLRIRGLTDNRGSLPTAALADEILLPGEGQVKALIVLAGNPVAAWPDQARTLQAIEKLELLVCLDIKRSATSKLAHYVIAPKLSLESDALTRTNEALYFYGTGNGYQKPFAQYAPAIVEPPAGSDLVEEWEFFYEIGRRMGLQLELPADPAAFRPAPFSVDMVKKPTTEELFRLLTTGSRISFEDVKRYPHGHVFDEPGLTVRPKKADWPFKLELANPVMMAELKDVSEEPINAADSEFPFKLICRRLPYAYNSSGRDLPRLAQVSRYNPAFMHSSSLAELGLCNGDLVEITSRHSSILGIIEVANDLLPGVVSMSHAFGDIPELDLKIRSIGSNTGRLISVEQEYDPYSGIPRMSSIPVRITAASAQIREAVDGA
jgi:anaerobic selenocysteine-containing dehydrogenase